MRYRLSGGIWGIGLVFVLCAAVQAEVTVTATVDRNRIALGESLQLTIAAQGTRSQLAPSLPAVDGLTFAGPSTFSNVSIVNGQMSRSVSLVYQVSGVRVGSYSIPALTLTVDGQTYQTEPIPITVEKNPVIEALGERLFARVKLDTTTLYVGQTAPLDIYLFARQDVPLRGLAGFHAAANNLGYRYLSNLQQGTQSIDGQAYRVFVVQGSISPTTPGSYVFGPTRLQVQLAMRPARPRSPQFGNSLIDQMLGNVNVQEVPVETAPLTIAVQDLPTDGRPADFSGAVGNWELSVEAKPVAVAVGDPVTVSIKIRGTGNIDTVPTPTLGSLDDFKTYEPTTETTKDERGTSGERLIEQVVIPKSVAATRIPAVQLNFFDPASGRYRVVSQDPIPLAVTLGSTNDLTVVGTTSKAPRSGVLGEDIVYLKGELGHAVPRRPFMLTTGFWVLNLLPPSLLTGWLVWRRRRDRLHRDVAYARRSRAARRALRILDKATTYDQAQAALQSYLGDRLNLTSSGITASIIDEQLAPRGLAPAPAERLRACFAGCDQARFAGGPAAVADLADMIREVRALILELESLALEVS